MLLRHWNICLALPVLLLAAASCPAQDSIDGFIARAHPGKNGVSMPYRLFIPDEKARAHALPLIVFLHGASGAGLDNIKQIRGSNSAGTHLWTKPEIQARHPAFVVAPQMPGDEQWGVPASEGLSLYGGLVLELITSLSKEFAIDQDRLYLMGQSRGGRGTWDLISKRPDIFAAALPLCGDGNPSRITAARNLPIWAFHGAKDTSVPVSGSRNLVAALKASGSAVKYSEYPDVGHDVWTVAFAEKDLPDWLFAQKRKPR